MNNVQDKFERIIQEYQGQRQADGSYNIHCPCPAHDDKNPSCNVKLSGDKILVHCYAGCQQRDVISELKSRDLWPKKINNTDNTGINLPPGIMPTWKPKGAKTAKQYTAHWTYRDPDNGQVIGYTVRYDNPTDKDIIPYFRRERDQWRTGNPEKKKHLYNAEYLKGNDLPVLIVEGEKTADKARDIVGKEYVCITWMGGCGSVHLVDWTLIQDRDVYVWPDNDQPGQKAAKTIQSKIPNAKIIKQPDSVPGKWDLADKLPEGWTRADVLAHIKTAAGDQATKKEPKFKLVKISDIEFKPADWLVYGFVEKDSMGLLFSDPGGGKTFIAIDMTCCVATGKDFHGKVVKQGPSVYIAGEGQNGLKRRFTAWSIRHQTVLDTAPIFLSLMPAGLCDEDQTDFVIEAIQAVADEYGDPSLIVLDTVARNFGPGDENSTKDMSGFIASVDKIREKFKACILLVHHSGHADKSRARGAMALKGALDAEYRLDKDETGVIRVTNTKMKDHQPPAPMAFRLNTVELPFTDDQGNPVTSAILDDTEYQPPPVSGKKGRGKWQTVATEVLKSLYKKHSLNLEASGYDVKDAKVLMEDWRRACLDKGMSRAAWKRVKDNLKWNPDVHQDGAYIQLLTEEHL